ncbi:MAG: hypothetical protein ACK559_35550, partial [bacterium]
VGSGCGVVHVGPVLKEPCGLPELAFVHCSRLSGRGYRDASCRLVTKVDCCRDVHLHLGRRVSSSPHDSAQILCDGVGVHPLVELGEVLRECVSVLPNAQGHREQIYQGRRTLDQAVVEGQ